jgi:peptide/nickel transport system substrate-binding protein
MNIGAPPEEAQLAVREPPPEYARIYEGYSSPSEFPYKYEYDPALSKKLLAKAGFPNGIDIDLMANTNHLKTREAGRVRAGMLRKANIRVNLVQLSPRSFRNGFRKHRRKPAKGFKPFLFFNSFGGGGGDSDLQCGSIFGCRGSWSGWCDKKIEKMIDQASSSQDYKIRHKIFADIAKKGSDVLAVVPLYRLHATFGLSNRVDWSPRVDERIMAWEIGLSGSN